MGLTKNSTRFKAANTDLIVKKTALEDRIIALAGNPNVGKSTVFNSLTGLNQHTGNWPGKTVASARGVCRYNGRNYVLVDIPGTYSLMPHSAEEEVARDFICFGRPDAVIVVCDATCLERNLNLVLQTIEITPNVVVCVNLMDEAKRKKIHIDLDTLSKRLGVPVIGTVARKKRSLDRLLHAVETVFEKNAGCQPVRVDYGSQIEQAVEELTPLLIHKFGSTINPRWLALRLLDEDKTLAAPLKDFLKTDIYCDKLITEKLNSVRLKLEQDGISRESLRDRIVKVLILTAEEICRGVVSYDKKTYNSGDRRIDRLLTSRRAGIPIMVLMLLVVFWITITGANYPSGVLAGILFWVQDRLSDVFMLFNLPDWLHGALVLGVYRVLAWVVSVMLPPMAIFFPLFTLLEDLGYLPRVAFNLDKYFKKCCACGKQALTMCMGFGCNAAGIIGCRIIDSPRERLIAVLTNSFVPCNGRFPTLIAILAMFFVGTSGGLFNSVLSAALLTLLILLGVGMTFAVSLLLSKTVLKGVPSSFTLELPPYRRPQIGRVIVRSVFDRTLFVLCRAAAVAAPAGLIIWIMANVTVGGNTLLAHCSGFLDPFGRLLGMDGVILLAFILGFPANEIVIPIIIMSYMSIGTIAEFEDLLSLKQLLIENGWTWITAVSTMLFSLFHWPCSTTCLTIGKETGSLKWTAVSFALPTVVGMAVCFLFANTAKLFV
jgi:ferrous iron transport protein B